MIDTKPAALTVTAAAIMHPDGRVYSLPPPARHANILWMMVEKRVMPPDNALGGEQGFLLSDGRFCRRKPAGVIALKAGQIKELRWPPSLYSEDLW